MKLTSFPRCPFCFYLSHPSLAQGSYLQLLTKSFPYISFTSTFSVLSAVALVVNQLAWYMHFSGSAETLEYALCFCLVVVWLVPIILMLSIASSDGVLPGAPGVGASMSSSPAGQSQEPLYSSRKRGFLLQIIYIVQAYSMPYIKLVSSYFGVRGRNSKRDHHM